MANPERQGEGNQPNPAQIVALSLLGKIKEEDLGENDRMFLNFYGPGGLMEDNENFRNDVYREMENYSKKADDKPVKTEDGGPIEVLALIRLGRVRFEDLGEEYKAKITSFEKKVAEDPELEKKIFARENEIALRRGNSEKNPLYTSTELKKHRNSKKTVKDGEYFVQPDLFQNRQSGEYQSRLKSEKDPEAMIMDVGRRLNDRFYRYHKEKEKIEDQKKKLELRDKIGLPIARRGTEYSNDSFYKFLVRRIVTWDMFHLFSDYIGIIGDTPEELEGRIEETRNLVNELLTGRLHKYQKFGKFNNFVDKHREEWNITIRNRL